MTSPRDRGSDGADDTGPQRVTRGFLFADLRDYTAFLERHGAAAAAELLDRYRTIVRAAVLRHRGSEIKTEGDSFYVVFPSVSAAVQCGLSIVAGANDANSEPQDQPIRVGVGIHAGETVETGEGYVGSAVNIAARVCAQAEAGEVLVTDTVRALTQTVLPVRFVSRGRRHLKGIAEPVALFAVRLQSAAPALRPAEGIFSGRLRSRRTGYLIVAVALVGGLSLALGFRILIGSRAQPVGSDGGLSAAGSVPLAASCAIGTPGSDVVVELDRQTGELCKTVPMGKGAQPEVLAADQGVIWVGNFAAKTLARVGPSSLSPDVFGAGGSPTGLAVGDGSLWVSRSFDGTLGRFSPVTQSEVRSINVGIGAKATVFADGKIWVANGLQGAVLEVDPETNTVIKTIPVGNDPTHAGLAGIAVSRGELWAVLGLENQVWRVDLLDVSVHSRIPVGKAPDAIALGPGDAWVTNAGDGSVSRIDLISGSPKGVIKVGVEPGAVAIVDNQVWVADRGNGTISRIDPRNGTVQALSVVSTPSAILDAGDVAWLATVGP
jgi:YVTN family beta-propeller protein